MKKKSMLLVTAAGFLAGLAAACVIEGGAAYGYVGDGDGGYILKNAVVTEEEVVIPSEINGRPVSKIDDHLFFENKKIKSVKIPGSVKVIGTHAFAECPSLERVVIEDGVEYIEYRAFTSPLLKELVIPGSVREIEDFAFECERLEKLTILPGKLKDASGIYSPALKEIILPDNVTVPPSECFSECRFVWSAVNAESPYDAWAGMHIFGPDGLISDWVKEEPVVIDKRYPFSYYGGHPYTSREVYLQWEDKPDLYRMTIENIFLCVSLQSLMRMTGETDENAVFRENMSYKETEWMTNAFPGNAYSDMWKNGEKLTFYVPYEEFKTVMEQKLNDIRERKEIGNPVGQLPYNWDFVDASMGAVGVGQLPYNWDFVDRGIDMIEIIVKPYAGQ